MNTWTSRVCAALVCLTVSACAPALEQASPDAPDPLRSAALNRGKVMLVAPSGFCIDPQSLRRQFALMARCDTLGGSGAEDAPLAVITATTVRDSADAPVTAQDLRRGDETVLDSADVDGVTLVQVRGTAPTPELSDTYWRAAGPVGGQIIGLVLYEAQDSASLGPNAPRLLQQTLQRTQAQTVVSVLTFADKSATPNHNKQSADAISGLFTRNLWHR